MSSINSKRQKLSLYNFKEEWTKDYFFIENKGIPICLVCGESVSVPKKYNLERHYSSKHKELDNVQGEIRFEKINHLKKQLKGQQSILQHTHKQNSSIVRASYEVSELIAKALKPHSEGEFIKECLVTAAKVLTPDKVKLFESISLSRKTVSDRICEMANDIELTLKKAAASFRFYSLAVDETLDITSTAQLAIFIRGVDSDFHIREELLCLKSMHGSTTGEEIFSNVKSAIIDYELSFEKLIGIATDGAPSMVGTQKGLVALIKKELEERHVDNNLIVFHCIIHQQNLCAVSLKMTNVMSIVVKCINFIKSKGLNNRQFREFLLDLEACYGNLLYYCEVRWLSKGSMLKRFYELGNELMIFMDGKNMPIHELEKEEWLCDLAFLVDITQHLNNLNVKLQGPDLLITSLYTSIKSFQSMLQLWMAQLKKTNLTHFPTLHGRKPVSTVAYSEACSLLYDEFEKRFIDLKKFQIELQIFDAPFNVRSEDAPDSLQLELINLQCDNALKAKFNCVTPLQFYSLYLTEQEFPLLRNHALKVVSLFGTTYKCEQFFSKLKLTKNPLRARLTDSNMSNQLRLASSTVPPNFTELSEKKQMQPSH